MILPSASPLGWLLALATAVAYVLPAALAPRAGAAGRLAMAPAWVLHAAALAWGLLLDGTPHFGFAPRCR